MKKFISTALNILFFTIVIFAAITVATVALTRKVNEYKTQYSQGIQGTVIKQIVPVLSFSSGFVKKLHVKIGQEIKKNDLLVEVDNPVLKGKVQALQNYPDNISAQTEAKVANEELKSLNIYAPVDGVVEDISVSEGTPVENFTKVLTVYSNEQIKLLAELTVQQYQAVQQLHQAQAYSARLNQSFIIYPDTLKPDEQTPIANSPTIDASTKKIGLYFIFKNKGDAVSLLNNEDVDLQLGAQDEKINKPIDFFVNFWDGLLAANKKQ